VTNLLKMLRRLIGEHIDLQFSSQSGLPLVEADAGMLEQVLMNLVVNARDAMPKGGHITILNTIVELHGARLAENPERRPGRFVCLAVSDTGCGMEASVLKRVFEPFFTTKEVGKGTGLGLATVHGIVAQHKGWVEVESAVGTGTTFRVFLPALAVSATPSPEPAQTPALHCGHETILLVEDDANVRRTVAQTLRVLGYRVYEAATGPAALTLWLTCGDQVDLLLTDMVMPEGVTGLELIEKLQALKPRLKAIISSGYSGEIVHAGAPDKRGLLYLPKPYPAELLAQTVRKCLDGG
jgi:CheY-like chemotaxis protein